MGYSWQDKLRMWICEHFGHQIDIKKDREFKGAIHNSCKRCRFRTVNGKTRNS